MKRNQIAQLMVSWGDRGLQTSVLGEMKKYRLNGVRLKIHWGEETCLPLTQELIALQRLVDCPRSIGLVESAETNRIPRWITRTAVLAGLYLKNHSGYVKRWPRSKTRCLTAWLLRQCHIHDDFMFYSAAWWIVINLSCKIVEYASGMGQASEAR